MGFTMRTRLFVCSVLVAVVGFSSALLIYLRAGADDESDANVQIVVVDGKTYRYPMAITKAYQRDLQRFGGGAAVLFDDIARWIEGRVHGRSLGITLAWITAFLSLAMFLLGREISRSPTPALDHDRLDSP
jgi:hypothetical protein